MKFFEMENGYESRPVIYVDMDGVLADFNTAARELLGATDSEENRAAQAGRWPHRRAAQEARRLRGVGREDEFTQGTHA